jgi:uncharacterized protein
MEARAVVELAANHTGCVALVTKIVSGPDQHELVASGLSKLMVLSMEQPGFVSAEIVPSGVTGSNEWSLIQRFLSAGNLNRWSSEESRSRFLGELTSQLGDSASVSEERIAGPIARGSVATAIMTKVKPGMEPAYRDWEARIHAAQARREGYQGSYVQPPTKNSQQWMTLLRFDSPEALDQWFISAEREQFLKEVEKLVSATEYKHIASSFPGWFPVDPATGNNPPNWKSSALVLLSIYPIVTLELHFLLPHLKGLNPSTLGQFISNLVSVAACTWLMMPFLIKVFRFWLFPKEGDPSAEIKGTILIILAFVAEITVFAVLKY